MTDDERRKKDGVEIMPPAQKQDDAPLGDRLPNVSLPSMPLGSTYLGRIKWKATARLIGAYREMVEEMEGTHRALGLLDDAKIARQIAKRRLADAERIHTIDARRREIDFLKTEDELEETKLQMEINAYNRERRRRELLQEKAPAEPEKPWEKVASKLQDIMEAEREMRAWFEDMKAQEISKAGGEEHLSKDQRKMLEDLKMRLDDEILKMRVGQG